MPVQTCESRSLQGQTKPGDSLAHRCTIFLCYLGFEIYDKIDDQHRNTNMNNKELVINSPSHFQSFLRKQMCRNTCTGLNYCSFGNHYWLNIQFQVSFESCVYKQICVQTCEWECELSLLGNKRCFKVYV